MTATAGAKPGPESPSVAPATVDRLIGAERTEYYQLDSKPDKLAFLQAIGQLRAASRLLRAINKHDRAMAQVDLVLAERGRMLRDGGF